MAWFFRFLPISRWAGTSPRHGARACVTAPSVATGHGHSPLSLLLRHQLMRNPSTRVHALFITAGLHRVQADEVGLRLWNPLLRLYALGSFPEDALLLYRKMLHVGAGRLLPGDTFTLSFLVKACANLSQLGNGTQVHGVTLKKGFESDVYVQTALLNMYCEFGLIREAQQVFDAMPERNLVTWNAMMTGLMRWGAVDHARMLFYAMHDRNVISWTCMIDGYTRANRFMEALLLFCKMIAEGLWPTEITVLAIAPAISNLGALDIAESIHAYCEKNGLNMSDVRVSNCLIDMYAKCGSIDSSLKVFNDMADERNLVSWTSIVSGFAMHGMAKEVVELLEGMGKEEIRPNRVTFLCMLNACSHGGLVNEGLKIFSDMVHVYGIEPEIKHYGCVIDMLGRAGRLEEAEKMILEMPVDVNVVVWRTLLNCCGMHGNAEVGERVLGRILELERGYGGDYVILSNVFSVTGRFQNAEEIRKLMDERNVSKVPGHSIV
uniref:Pentatricopeptide repeat-containing protein At1g09220, mitochondrial n=1 Tax=Anthurium amnicola TaxID=1678845 RepID=A0A1D1XJK2_9ARAE